MLGQRADEQPALLSRCEQLRRNVVDEIRGVACGQYVQVCKVVCFVLADNTLAPLDTFAEPAGTGASTMGFVGSGGAGWHDVGTAAEDVELLEGVEDDEDEVEGAGVRAALVLAAAAFRAWLYGSPDSTALAVRVIGRFDLGSSEDIWRLVGGYGVGITGCGLGRGYRVREGERWGDRSGGGVAGDGLCLYRRRIHSPL